MTGDRGQDRFVKVIHRSGGNLPRVSTVVLQFSATRKGSATGCAARRVSVMVDLTRDEHGCLQSWLRTETFGT